MAKLGRRERQAKREAILQAKALRYAEKERLSRELALLDSLPRRERLLLTQGRTASPSISRDYLLGHTHYKGCSAARGMTGNGGRVLEAKLKRQKLSFQGPRFAPGFIAVLGKQHVINQEENFWEDKELGTNGDNVPAGIPHGQRVHAQAAEYYRTCYNIATEQELAERARKADPLDKYLHKE